MFESGTRSEAAGVAAAAPGPPGSVPADGVLDRPAAAGAELAADLACRELAQLSGYALIDTITDWERLAGWAAAGQLAALAELARRRPDRLGRAGEPTSRGTLSVDEFAVDEVAAALHLARVTAGNRLDLAVELAGRLPGTSAALSAGEIDVPKARAVVEATRPLEPGEALAVESRVLVRAPRQTCGQLRASLARAAAAIHPVSAQERHERAAVERRVVLTPQPDGMAEIRALLPADGAVTLYGALDTLARHQGSDDRTMDQRRADALVGLADVVASPGQTTGAATRRPGRPLVQVSVDLAALLGLSQQPGELVGYGPIPAPMARRLAADADWHRLVTDPVTGRLLDYSPTTYTPPAALARHVRARDRSCRFPGCRRAADRCDLDHTVPHPDGPTTEENLGALCRTHHRLKHESDWSVRQSADAGFTWTSPTGHTYTRFPEVVGTVVPGHPGRAGPAHAATTGASDPGGEQALGLGPPPY